MKLWPLILAAGVLTFFAYFFSIGSGPGRAWLKGDPAKAAPEARALGAEADLRRAYERKR